MKDEELLDAWILIVDDQRANTLLLERMLTIAGYRHLRAILDPREVQPLCSHVLPDLILLDLHMPFLDGFQVMDQLRSLVPEGGYLPILILTADETPEARQRALSMGAKDFLNKPFNSTEVLLRIRNLLETRFLYIQIQNHNLRLEENVRERTRELEEANRQLVQAEDDKKRFYREVIRAVTHDKFLLYDSEEIPTEGELALGMSLESPDGYPMLRERLREIAEGAGMEGDPIDDFILAVGEAATNAIKHAVGGWCDVYVTDDRIISRVIDRGKGISPEALPATLLMPGFSTEVSLGMGYTLILELVDRVRLATMPGKTVVQVEKWIHPEMHPEHPLLAALDRF